MEPSSIAKFSGPLRNKLRCGMVSLSSKDEGNTGKPISATSPQNRDQTRKKNLMKGLRIYYFDRYKKTTRISRRNYVDSAVDISYTVLQKSRGEKLSWLYSVRFQSHLATKTDTARQKPLCEEPFIQKQKRPWGLFFSNRLLALDDPCSNDMRIGSLGTLDAAISSHGSQ